MRIVEEAGAGYAIKCDCGNELYILKKAGVADCLECGRNDDPRRLRHKWARGNDHRLPNPCQAL
ncbi:MAG: hypothetical protein ACE5EM_08440 [Sphingomonadales bacterium]